MFIDNLVYQKMDEERKKKDAALIAEKETSVTAQPSQSANTYENPWGFDENKMKYLESRGFDKNRLEAMSKFDPNRKWNEQLREFEKMKPQYSEKGNGGLNRSTWGAIGDSMKLLAQLGAASAGAYIEPNKETLTDYFAKLDEKGRNRYLDSMNRYQKAVNQAKMQNQKYNYSQYQAEKRELNSILSNKERLDDSRSRFEENQERLKADKERNQKNTDRNYDLRKKQVENSMYNNNERTKAYKEKRTSGRAEQSYYDRLFYEEAGNNTEILNSLPDSFFDIHFDRDYNPVKKLKNNPTVRRLVVEKYLKAQQGSGQGTVQGGSQYTPQSVTGWNNSIYNPDNNPDNRHDSGHEDDEYKEYLTD